MFRARRLAAITVISTTLAGVVSASSGMAAATTSPSTLQVSGGGGTSGECTLTSGTSGTFVVAPPPTHGQQHAAGDYTGTYSATTDATDTVTISGHYSSTSKAVGRTWGLFKASITGTGNAEIQWSKGRAGSVCTASNSVGAEFDLTFREAHRGWLYVERSMGSRRAVSLISIVQRPSYDSILEQINQGARLHSWSRVSVLPGDFGAELAVGVSAGEATDTTNTLHLSFHRPGTAVRIAGQARRFLSYPVSISCSHPQVALTWTRLAAHVSHAVIRVNNYRRVVVSHPRPATDIVIRHLRPQAQTVVAHLRLTDGRSVRARGMYAPCSP
jgi:hypothetical protein